VAGSSDRLDALAKTLARFDPRESIRPGTVQLVADEADHVAVDEHGLTALAPRLVLGATLGEGGMALVRAATQTSLGREVAVKTARPGTAARAAPGLLREAWVTGRLEHPNIVPIHDVGADEAGHPLLVLKRVEGRPWSDVIRERPVEWNVEQLVHVCHAIAFAHSRGIVHRDLKPGNVMIGEFGEVYVLDWGIAVSLVDDGSGRLPLAAASREVTGTLVYMAPEMLDGLATERTDVYQLGAMVYEIAAGMPPHVGETVETSLASIARSDPELPADTDPELVAICRRAMAPDPADRFASAEALRVALTEFLAHRGSAAIARAAQTELTALEEQLAARADRVALYQRFGECRFGFDAALRAWPDNAAARAGRERALGAMARYELANGDARAAAVLLADLVEPLPELTAQLAALERTDAARRSRIAELEELGADRDIVAGHRARTAFLVLFGLAWSAAPLAAGVFPAIEVGHALSLVVTGASLAAVLAFGWLARAALGRTALNRGIGLTILVALLLHGIVEAMAWALGLAMPATHAIAVALWAGVCGAAAVFLDRALVVPTVGFLAALAACVRTPGQRLWAISASLAVLFGTALYVWYRSRGGGRPIAGLADRLRRGDRGSIRS